MLVISESPGGFSPSGLETLYFVLCREGLCNTREDSEATREMAGGSRPRRAAGGSVFGGRTAFLTDSQGAIVIKMYLKYLL